MTNVTAKSHWENVYQTKSESEVSWFQETARTSLELLDINGVTRDSAIIDIGGGVSRLADNLVERGFRDITILDISGAALKSAQARLGQHARTLHWIEADITQWSPGRKYDVWHDRAVLHFLTQEQDRTAYLAAIRKGLKPGGLAIIATFAPDGPEKCSGLVVQRYSPESLAEFLGSGFRLLDSRRETHVTPWGSEQKFQFSRFIREEV